MSCDCPMEKISVRQGTSNSLSAIGRMAGLPPSSSRPNTLRRKVIAWSLPSRSLAATGVTSVSIRTPSSPHFVEFFAGWPTSALRRGGT